MITTAANNYADALLEKSKHYDALAKTYATSYASSDKKEDQAAFRHNNELSEIFRKLHGESCRFMHSIESEMRDRVESQIKDKAKTDN